MDCLLSNHEVSHMVKKLNVRYPASYLEQPILCTWENYTADVETLGFVSSLT